MSSLRLLKLLCAPVLDMRRLDVGGMINKGAFSEIMAGMVSDGMTNLRTEATAAFGSLIGLDGVEGLPPCMSLHEAWTYQLCCAPVSADSDNVLNGSNRIPSLPQHTHCNIATLRMLLQYYAPGGSAPMAVALKVMDCSQDDACSFERVYNEVRQQWPDKTPRELRNIRCSGSQLAVHVSAH